MATFITITGDEWINLDQVVTVEKESDGSVWVYYANPVRQIVNGQHLELERAHFQGEGAQRILELIRKVQLK